MDVDAVVNADDKEQLQVEEIDDSCKIDFIEIVPRVREANYSCTSECVSSEVREADLVDLKQEPDDVCCFFVIQFIAAEVICKDVLLSFKLDMRDKS